MFLLISPIVYVATKMSAHNVKLTINYQKIPVFNVPKISTTIQKILPVKIAT